MTKAEEIKIIQNLMDQDSFFADAVKSDLSLSKSDLEENIKNDFALFKGNQLGTFINDAVSRLKELETVINNQKEEIDQLKKQVKYYEINDYLESQPNFPTGVKKTLEKELSALQTELLNGGLL